MTTDFLGDFKKLTTGLLAATLLISTAGVANAQVTGIVTFAGSAEAFSFAGDDYGYWWHGGGDNKLVDISGKLGVVVAPSVSVQVEGWARRWYRDYNGENVDGLYSVGELYTDVGGAAHLTYSAGDFLVGVAAGLGQHWTTGWNNALYTWEDATTYATLALEGGYDADDFRIIGQAGVSVGVAGTEVDLLTPFASVTGTYYITQDLALSASASIDSTYYDDGNKTHVTGKLGGELRHKFKDTPLVLSIGYTATMWNISDGTDYTYNQVNHRATVGLSIPFGDSSSTLRDLDRATGLTLHDPNYGLK